MLRDALSGVSTAAAPSVASPAFSTPIPEHHLLLSVSTGKTSSASLIASTPSPMYSTSYLLGNSCVPL